MPDDTTTTVHLEDELCRHPPTVLRSAYTAIHGGLMQQSVSIAGYRFGKIIRRVSVCRDLKNTLLNAILRVEKITRVESS